MTPVAVSTGLRSTIRLPKVEWGSLRVAAGIAAIWVLNVVDLILTHEAAARGTFVESNPLAAASIGMPALLVGYKLALVGLGTAILFRLRHRRGVEAVCGAMVVVYLGVLFAWTRYYDYLEICLSDPATVRPPLIF